MEKVAKYLLNKNVPLAQIIEATGLSENEINKILKN
jgi:hypothetical protein